MGLDMIPAVAFIALTSLVVALIATPACRQLCLRLELVDHPDSLRKLHPRALPRLGGIPLLLAYAAGLGVLTILADQSGGQLFSPRSLKWQLPAGALLVFGTGLLDDIFGLRPWRKLVLESAAAALVWSGGIRVFAVHGYDIDLWLSFPVTVIWLVGSMNAFNLIDGLDGLAAGVGIFATVTVALVALIQGNFALALVSIPLAAALLGFLCYNFNPASIFLGDSGSLLTGFLLGCYGALWSQKSATALGMLAPLTALAFPLLDATLAIVRRFVRSQPISAADRAHIHHRLLDRGLTPRRAVLILYGCCALAAALSLLQSVQAQFSSVVVLALCGAAWLGIQRLGYIEFGALGRVFGGGALRSALALDIHLIEFSAALAKAETADECWAEVRRYYKRFGFRRVELNIAGKTYVDEVPCEAEARCWKVEIPLSQVDSVQLCRNSESTLHSSSTASFADRLGTGLRAKINTFHDVPTVRVASPSELAAGAAGVE